MSRPRSLLVLLLAVCLPVSMACGANDSTARSAGASVTDSKSERAEESRPDPVPLRAARQRARLTMLPQIADVGAKARKASAAKSAMVASFKPRSKGRPVLLQRKQGRRWATVSRARQDRSGRAELTAPFKRKGKVQVYRVAAPRHDGLAAVRSKGVRTDLFEVDYSDEFSGSVLGPDWKHHVQGYQPSSRRKCVKVDPQAVKVGGGTVKLSVIDDPARPTALDTVNGTQRCSVQGGRYHWRLNGHIHTVGAQEFTYGFFAARVKFQKPRGQHGSFWLFNDATAHETDVIEWFGKNQPQGGLTSFVYSNGVKIAPGCSGKQTQGCGFIQKPGQYGGKWWSRYHVFSVEWTKKRYVFRIDGQQTFTTRRGVSDDPSYLKLSVLASDYELQFLDGDNAADDEGQQALEALKRVTMSVDWVRHWKR